MGPLRAPRLYIWYPRKLLLLGISLSSVMQSFEIVDLIFFCTTLPYEYLDPDYDSVFLILVRKYRTYTINRWRVVCSVGPRCDFTIKTVVVFVRKNSVHVHGGQSVTIVWRLDSFTISFPGDVRGESGLTELASVILIGELSSIVDIWFKNGVT